MLQRLALAATAALLSLGMAGAAQASLIGQTVTCSVNGGLIGANCTAPTATVGPGAEFEIRSTVVGGRFWSIDLDADSITMALVRNGGVTSTSTGQVILGDLFWSDEPTATIIGIANFTVVGITGVIESSIAVNDNSIVIGYQPAAWARGSFISFDLVTSHSQQLPEPATLALFGFGLLGLGLTARRRP